ncbi:hypothetical protein IMCC9480_671 [Oxalobacteraceae bacterium IMCC9480]|nr:hypothetical protein IMCC9480_671 [Oxalobacteraceae bacterium IMCC9480]
MNRSHGNGSFNGWQCLLHCEKRLFCRMRGLLSIANTGTNGHSPRRSHHERLDCRYNARSGF